MPNHPRADRPKPVGLPGLRARVIRGPNDDGRWYWRIENAKGEKAAPSRWATPQEIGKAVGQISSGVERHAAPSESSGDNIDTVDALLRAHIANLEDTRPELAEGTFRAYRLRTRQVRDIASAGGYRLDRLDASAMDVIRGSLARSLSPRSVRACLELIGAAWKWGRRDGITPDRELVVPDIAVEDAPKVTPTETEIARVVGQIEVEWGRLAVRLLWATGCRIGELAALTWDRVDLERGTIRLTGKTGERIVPLRADLRADLAARAEALAPDAPPGVLGVTFNTVRVNVPRMIAKACRKLKLTPWTPHALRRAAVDTLARANVDVSTAAALLGHTPEVMLEYYRQVTDEDLAAAAAVLGGPGGRGPDRSPPRSRRPRLLRLDGGKP